MDPKLLDVIERVPGWGDADGLKVERILGGLTNKSYRVDVGGDSFVLRLAGDNGEMLGLNRRQEFLSQRAAATIGVAPEAVHLVEPEGHLVSRYITGRRMHDDEFREQRNTDRMLDVLKRVHALPPVEGDFDPCAMILGQVARVRAAGGDVPELFLRLLDPLRAIDEELKRELDAPCLCHNDPCNGNFLEDGAMWLIDWEWGGMGDPFFDLAFLALSMQMTAESTSRMLARYFGRETREHRDRLDRMTFVVHLREAGWALVQRLMDTPTKLDVPAAAFNVDDCLNEHLVTAERLLARLDRK
ncbi:MAG: phosphotransferase family protein [bacterium]|nr:phosphotransferase family protein [bacterium]